MRTVFLGTSEFALPILRELDASSHIDLRLVLSRPSKPSGRGLEPTDPPVAIEAKSLGIDLAQPRKPGEASILDRLRRLSPRLMVCAAYGAYMPESLIGMASLGVVNVHPSLLPAYRGAAPVARAIMEGKTVTGVSFMLTDTEGWDTGPVLTSFSHPVNPEDTTGSLTEKLSRLAGRKVVEVVVGYAEGDIEPAPQEGEPSYARKIEKSETWIDWTEEAARIERLVRALQPSPGARTRYGKRMLKVVCAEVAEGDFGKPGTVRLVGEGIVIACGRNGLRPLVVQPESRKAIAVADFVRGYRPRDGERFGGRP
ncbi:methionyl-tRNA formyltransferase [Candidatus Fermentibacteria bacterium]|nr:methionyl-tRNA formyltransferase [Candidatus Fermentibacteria bacterium]